MTTQPEDDGYMLVVTGGGLPHTITHGPTLAEEGFRLALNLAVASGSEAAMDRVTAATEHSPTADPELYPLLATYALHAMAAYVVNQLLEALQCVGVDARAQLRHQANQLNNQSKEN